MSNFKNKPLVLLGSILLSQSAGIIGSLFTFSAIDSWYRYLNKPIFSPPSWLFGPVWIFLYTLIGIALYFVYYSKHKLRGFTLKLFLIHLGLNAIWSVLFFGLKNPGIAFVEIVVMWATLVYLMKLFIQFEKRAFYLFIPYLLWVSFASVLNLAVWLLN